jgi:effector-binding domain-containing protein
VRLQQVPEAWLAYTRYHSPCDPDAFLLRFSELRQLMREHAMQGRGCQMAIFHDDYQQFNYEKADIEVCMELRGLTAAGPQALLRLRQPHTVATILHRGSYQQSPQSYRVLLDWIWKHGWQAVGPAQERYLVDAGQTQDSRDYLTELAIPVEQK